MGVVDLGTLPGEVLAFLAIIGTAVLIGAVPLLRAFASARHENECLERIEKFSDAVFGDTAHRLTARTGLEGEVSVAQFGDTATAARVHALARLVEHGLPLDRSALTAASEERLTQPLRVPRAVSSSLILIGLAGTLLGLTQAVLGLGSFGGVQPAVQDGGLAVEQLIQQQSALIDQLLKSIQATLGGMKTAFIPALAAVALTILLLLVLHVVQDKLDGVAARLETLTDEILLPLYRPGTQDRLQEAQFLAFRASEALLAASERTARVLATSLDSMETRMAAAAQQASAAVSAGSSAAVQSLRTFLADARVATEESGRLLTAGAQAAATQFTTSASGAAKSVAAIQERIQRSAERLDATAAELSTAVKTAGTAASGIAEALSIGGRVAERLSEAESQHQETVRLITDQLKTAQQEATRVTETSARLAEALQNLDQTRLAMRDLVALQQQWHRDTLNAVAANTLRAEEGVREIHQAVERIEKSAGSLGDRIRQVHVPDPAQRDQRLIDYLAEVITTQNRISEDRWSQLMRRLEVHRAAASPVNAVPSTTVSDESTAPPVRLPHEPRMDGGGVIPAFIEKIRSRFR